ncbi:MAG: hypothetical protein JSU69_11350 [Candidatus Zixiibacteriota bacterium]|nr:MAG: hypothetical protein JSU69_11350 [candidate division Zixibacteria bacterium]
MLILYKISTFLIFYLTYPFTYIARITGSVKWANRTGFLHRCGRGGCDIWLHASSVGEVKVLGILVKQLQKLNSGLSLYVTVMTETGYQRARESIDVEANVGYLPLDYRGPIKRFLNAVCPRCAVFIETEIWPNIILELNRRQVPIFLANGRMSEKAFRRYRRVRRALGCVLKCYRAMMMQTENDKDRFVKIGADPGRITVLGNLKFDAPVNTISAGARRKLKDSLPFPDDASIFIAGSTRGGEHEIILDTLKNLMTEHAKLKLILAPRHLDRIGEIRSMIENRGFEYALYTGTENKSDDAQVLIVDKIGVLNDLYAISSIAFVGGTMVDIGGQNILEPVWAGIPVVYGPSIYNVKDSSDYIIEGNYGVMVHDSRELYQKLKSFLKGEIKFRTKTDANEKPSRAHTTAVTILESIQSNAKNLAQDNIK